MENRFGAALKNLRKQRGLTQVELANALGTGKSTISMYEVGRRSPDFDTLFKLGDLLGADMNTLLGYQPQTEVHTIRRVRCAVSR